jgi:hypothetical protein
MAVAEVWQILQVSRNTNPDKGITGALFANASFFAQVIEGPREAVQEVFARINADQRHFDVTVLERGSVTERYFPRWAMGLASLDFDVVGAANYLLEGAFLAPGEKVAAEVRALIQSSISNFSVY